MRIAIGGISTESCTFSPLPTREEDFRILRGQEYLTRYPFLQSINAEFVPLLFARAMPGGPVERRAYEKFRTEFLERLAAAGPLDGVYLELHGAMNVQGMDDAEGDWIAAARQVVGQKCLISASFDLHANVSRREVESLDMLTAFRTAPHVDVEATREKAVRMLVRCINEKLRPYRAFVPLPVALPGEVTSTEWEPGTSLYAALKESDPVPGILDASILIGYAWADEPRVGACIAVTGMDRKNTEAEALRLARRFWDVHQEFRFGVQTGSIDECIDRALAAPERCAFISDSGDNPTAGGVGDVPLFLSRLLARKVQNALVAGLVDAPAVAACYASGVGSDVRFSLGGKLDTKTAPPLPVSAKVLSLGPDNDRQSLIQIDGVKVILSEKRRPYHFVVDMQKMGAEPLEHRIVVIKIGYLEPDLKRHAPLALLALSPGAVDQAIERLPFARIRRPMYPLDKNISADEVVKAQVFEPIA